MSQTIVLQDGKESTAITTMERMKLSRAEFLNELKNLHITDAIKIWLANLKPVTSKTYGFYIKSLIDRGFIVEYHPDGRPFSVSDFNEVLHEAIIDHIKRVDDWKESTRQARAAGYISFTTYLERISSGWFRRALPSKTDSNKTFFQVRRS